MSGAHRKPTDWELRTASGPEAASFRLRQPGPLFIGRRSIHAIHLNDPAVSRRHARLTYKPTPSLDCEYEGEWLLDDLGSSHGTWINGVRLKTGRRYHLRTGDLVVVGPWTFVVTDRLDTADRDTTLVTVDDAALASNVITRTKHTPRSEIPQRDLHLLYECSERIHGAGREAAVIEAVLEAATTATDFDRVAFLRPLTEEGVVEVVACHGKPIGERETMCRGLVRETSSGEPAKLLRGSTPHAIGTGRGDQEQIVAMCVPVLVETTLTGYLYFDTPKAMPNNEPRTGRSDAFASALAQLAALGLANCMRAEMVRRQARMEAEYAAAVESQRWLLPPRRGEFGPFTYIGEIRRSPSWGGDFFDIILLDNERLAVVVGDPAGSGTSVVGLASNAHGYLRAELLRGADPTAALCSLNEMILSRGPIARLVKTWIGILDSKSRSLCYASAGRSCALRVAANGACSPLTAPKTLPLGAKADQPYALQTEQLCDDDRVLILSDGFIDQRADDRVFEATDSAILDTNDSGSAAPADSMHRVFGIECVEKCLQETSSEEDELVRLFDDLERHAGTDIFDDDVTAVLIKC